MRTFNIKSNNATLKVFSYNEKKTDTILLLNGGPGISYYLEDIASFLQKQMRVISFNQRGIGSSERFCKGFTIDDYIDDINHVIKHFNLENFHLFGHAWGGLLGQLYYNKYPAKVKSLFLCNSFIGVGNQWKVMENEVLSYFVDLLKPLNRFFFKFLISLLKTPGFSAIALGKIIDMMYLSYKRKQNIKLDSSIIVSPLIMIQTREAMINSVLKFSDKIPDIPVVLCYSSEDFIQEYRWRLEERWPSSQVVIIDDCGHFPWLEKKNEFYSLLSQYYGID